MEILLEHGPPLMMAGALLLLTGIMMFSTGLIGEVIDQDVFRESGPEDLRGCVKSVHASPPPTRGKTWCNSVELSK